MEIGDILTWVLMMAVTLAFIWIITGKFFELRVETTLSELAPKAYLLLNSFLAKNDIFFEKLLIDKNTFNSLTSTNFQILGFDYKLNFSNKIIKNFDGNENKFNDDKCYTDAGLLMKTKFSTYFGLCERDFYCKAKKISIEAFKTPASELAYWLSYACTTNIDFEKNIRILKGDIGGISIKTEKKKICIDDYCEDFITCGKSIKIESYKDNQDCGYIKVNSTNYEIIIKYPK